MAVDPLTGEIIATIDGFENVQHVSIVDNTMWITARGTGIVGVPVPDSG